MLIFVLCAPLADDAVTSPLFTHFLNLGNAKGSSAKATTGVDMSAYKKMMKNFDN